MYRRIIVFRIAILFTFLYIHELEKLSLIEDQGQTDRITALTRPHALDSAADDVTIKHGRQSILIHKLNP